MAACPAGSGAQATPGARGRGCGGRAHRREWAFVLAATARVPVTLDLAEECVQDAYVSALEAWSAVQGVPAQSRGLADHRGAALRAIDVLRRDTTLRRKLPLLVEPRMGQRRSRRVPSAGCGGGRRHDP